MSEIAKKNYLRAFIIIGSFSLLWGIIAYMIVKSTVNIRIEGVINLDMIIGSFVSIISFSLGYLFGVERK